MCGLNYVTTHIFFSYTLTLLLPRANDNVVDMFTRGSHHLILSVFLLSQNRFSKKKHSRTISLNTHYLVNFNNPRDRTQIAHLGRQIVQRIQDF